MLKSLWDTLWLLKLIAFLGSFGFCKRFLISWYLPQGVQTKWDAFLLNYLCRAISYWKIFHKCDNLNYVIINVERTYRVLHGQKCGKYFKEKTENRRTCEKAFFSFKLKISRFQTDFRKSKTSRKIMVFMAKISQSMTWFMNSSCTL